LYRAGTRILQSITELEPFRKPPWTTGVLEGMVDVPFLNLTPATRTGVIHDAALENFILSIGELERHLVALIEERKRAEEEQSSRDTLRAIQRAFREALLTLPAEEYEWFDITTRSKQGRTNDGNGTSSSEDGAVTGLGEQEGETPAQRQFFEYTGPLYGVRIAPRACTVGVGKSRVLHAIARDASRRHVTDGVVYEWHIAEGSGIIENGSAEYATFIAPAEPCLVRVSVLASQGTSRAESEAVITVTDSLLPETRDRSAGGQGLPGYTLEHAPGKLWRSRMDIERNLIVVNSGHRDYVFAARSRALKLRYLLRLYAKEMVLRNFPGLRGEELLDRLLELSLYTEEHLR
jgi:hypothetical protein